MEYVCGAGVDARFAGGGAAAHPRVPPEAPAAAAAPVQEIRPPHTTPVEIALTRGGTYRVDMQTQAVTYVPADASGLERAIAKARDMVK